MWLLAGSDAAYLPRTFPTRRSSDLPDDAEARLGETAERCLQPDPAREPVGLGYPHAVEDELARHRRAQRDLVVHVLSGETGHALLHEEAAHTLVRPRPNDSDVGQRPVRDPHLV